MNRKFNKTSAQVLELKGALAAQYLQYHVMTISWKFCGIYVKI